MREIMKEIKSLNKKVETVWGQLFIETMDKTAKLKEELEVYKKALELSIKKGVGLMGYGTVEIDRQAEIKWKEHYLEQARKE